MKSRINGILLSSILLFILLAQFFWVTGKLTHLTCCSQGWITSAPSAAIREERVQIRAGQMRQVEEMKRDMYEYSILCVAGAAMIGAIYLARRRVAQRA